MKTQKHDTPVDPAHKETDKPKRHKRTKEQMEADAEAARIAKLSPIEQIAAARAALDQKVREAGQNRELAEELEQEAIKTREQFDADLKKALG